MWGEGLHFQGPVNEVTRHCLELLVRDVKRVSGWTGKLEAFDWDSFFTTRGIDYKGDEVKTVRNFTWANIAPALSAEVGRVPLEEVCTLGERTLCRAL